MKFTVTEIKRMPRKGKSRCYVFHSGETVWEQFVDRRNRPNKLYREQLFPLLHAFLCVECKWGWSQKAGCSCGCSPGFVAKDHWGWDVFITITVTEEEA